MNMFNEVKSCKSYWKLLKNTTSKLSCKPILGIKGLDGKIVTSDQEKAEIFNEHFSSIGQKLADRLPDAEYQNSSSLINRVTPTVMDINITYESVSQGLLNLKPDKACGPDKVSPKLLKSAGRALIPSLLSLYNSSAKSNSVPNQWKNANVLSLYKKDDETEKGNYRPISLLCVPGKLLETCVSSTITNHLTDHHLSHPHQWAYKKGHSTELLLVKMTEEWRRALDNNLVVGVVFVDFRKAFDSISHPVLLRKLQELGVSGNLWSWIKNYLSNRHQVTVINGHTSRSLPVKFGVPQGSVLGPILFSLFCNDLPDINDSKEGKIFMYADDTTLYAIAPNHDLVAIILNKMLEKLFKWCCQNRLTPHPDKTELMLMSRKKFIGPLQCIKLGGSTIKQVKFTRCLGLQIDCNLNWNSHVSELILSFTQKLNLLKSLYFLPINAKLDFYFKVVLPSINYGILVWGSCGKTLFNELEKIHVRAAKVILGLDWYTPGKDVLAKAKWFTLNTMYKQQLLFFSYKHYYNLLPKEMQSLLIKTSHSYELRDKITYVVPKPNTEYLKKSISYQAVTLWNSVDKELKSTNSLARFKKAVKALYQLPYIN